MGIRSTELPVVTSSGVVSTDTLPINADGILSQITVKELIDALNGFDYFSDTGGDDAYGITSGLSLSALIAGMRFVLKPTTANTGACTLTVDSVTAKSIKVVDGSGVRDPLTGEIAAGMCAQLIYNGTYFILCNPVQDLKPKHILHFRVTGSPIASGDLMKLMGSTNFSNIPAPDAIVKIKMYGMTYDSSGGEQALMLKETIVSISASAVLTVRSYNDGTKWYGQLFADGVSKALTLGYEPDGTESEMFVCVELF